MSQPHKTLKPSKRDRLGRWSNAETNLFEELIERYGKNWRKIHEQMRGRTLSQIRSHAQKFFDKVGTRKVSEYERRAKLLEALETLENEKRFKQLEQASQEPTIKSEVAIKQEEEDNHQKTEVHEDLTHQSLHSHYKQAPRAQTMNKEEEVKKQEGDRTVFRNVLFPMQAAPSQNGFLMQLICFNPDAFSEYGLDLGQLGYHQIPQQPLYFPSDQK